MGHCAKSCTSLVIDEDICPGQAGACSFQFCGATSGGSVLVQRCGILVLGSIGCSFESVRWCNVVLGQGLIREVCDGLGGSAKDGW